MDATLIKFDERNCQTVTKAVALTTHDNDLNWAVVAQPDGSGYRVMVARYDARRNAYTINEYTAIASAADIETARAKAVSWGYTLLA